MTFSGSCSADAVGEGGKAGRGDSGLASTSPSAQGTGDGGSGLARRLPAHGTRARRLRGCLCPPCRAAHNRWCKEYALRRLRGETTVPVAETRRLMQALLQLMTWRRLAEELGTSSSQLHYVLKKHRTVSVKLARAVEDAAAFYLAPVGAAVIVDEVAVERALRGRRTPLTAREQTVVIAEARRRGIHASVVAEALGLTRSAVAHRGTYVPRRVPTPDFVEALLDDVLSGRVAS